MITQQHEELSAKHCKACEGGVPKYTPEQAQAQLEQVPGWRLLGDGLRIRRDWQMQDFAAAIRFISAVAHIAEQEGHHPDLHLEGYRHLWIELWTHAVGGLTENDFIVAAKIDELPVDEKT